jgi:hypothetical protein
MLLGLVVFSVLVMVPCLIWLEEFFKGVPAPTNLPVPPHFFNGSILTIGEDGGSA